MPGDPIHIVCAANAGYVPHVGAMLHSLFASNPGERFVVHFPHSDVLPAGCVVQLGELCSRHAATFAPLAVPRSSLEGLPIAGRYPEEAWYRVFLPGLLPDVSRALWLDADVIVLSPIRELWETDLGSLPLAACQNAVLRGFAGTVERLGVTDRARYFNSGVLLMDLERMRAEHSERLMRAAAQALRESIRFADQDVLNAVYHRRYRRLPLEWNVLTHSYFNVPESRRVHGDQEYEAALRKPRIVHFVGEYAKPWVYACGHPHRDAYLRHRALAGWPPPPFPDRNLRGRVARRVPLRLRVILNALRHRQYREMMSYLLPW